MLTYIDLLNYSVCFTAQKHELQKKHKEMLFDCQAKPHNILLAVSAITCTKIYI